MYFYLAFFIKEGTVEITTFCSFICNNFRHSYIATLHFFPYYIHPHNSKLTAIGLLQLVWHVLMCNLAFLSIWTWQPWTVNVQPMITFETCRCCVIDHLCLLRKMSKSQLAFVRLSKVNCWARSS